MLGKLENLIETAESIEDIDSNLLLIKDRASVGAMIDEREAKENRIYLRDWFYLIYYNKKKGIDIRDRFIVTLLSKPEYQIKNILILEPWSNDTLLHILAQVIYRKNKLKDIIKKEPTIIYERKPIDFNDLGCTDFGYTTNEFYRDEKQVMGLAKEKDIKYSKDDYIVPVDVSWPQKFQTLSVAIN